MGLSIESVELLLPVAAIVAMLARRLRVPYSVGLVVAGIILAFLPFTPKVELTKDLIFTVLLPPLIFEAAFYLHWKELRRDIPVVLVLATVGVLLSASGHRFWDERLGRLALAERGDLRSAHRRHRPGIGDCDF